MYQKRESYAILLAKIHQNSFFFGIQCDVVIGHYTREKATDADYIIIFRYFYLLEYSA